MGDGDEHGHDVPEDDTRRLAQREARGMRRDWSHVKGLTTIVRVLPPDLYDKVMLGDEPLAPGSSIFGPIARPAENGLSAPPATRSRRLESAGRVASSSAHNRRFNLGARIGRN